MGYGKKNILNMVYVTAFFRQFDNNGKVIYETTFKMRTGLWKEFHGNGKIYFETYTTDGYFTDTLRLHNKEGKNFEKRLYQKNVFGLLCRE